MPERKPGVHVVTTRRQYKDREYVTHLLRRSYREDGKVKKETLANLTALGTDLVNVIRAGLQGENVGVISELLPPVQSRPHGHVQAVTRAMERLGIANLLASRGSRNRSIILALIAARILDPQSNHATTRTWSDTTVASEFGVQDVRIDQVFSAMDWLADARNRIETKLAARHVADGDVVLFDLTSSYVEGEHHELAAYGHNRDKKRGKKQINWGILADGQGRPVALHVFPGTTADPTTLRHAVTTLQHQFHWKRFILVGDRGMITSRHIQAFQKGDADIAWITALRAKSLQKLAQEGTLQPSLFDETNLAEVTSPHFPGERLIACRNPVLARERAHHRSALLDATCNKLDAVKTSIANGRLRTAQAMALRVGAILEKFKMRKHMHLTIDGDHLAYSVDRDSVAREAATDGLVVVRSNVPDHQKDASDLVRTYEDLSHIEQGYRSIKTHVPHFFGLIWRELWGVRFRVTRCCSNGLLGRRAGRALGVAVR